MTGQSPFDRFSKNPQSDWWKEAPGRLDQLKAILARSPIPYVTDIMMEMGAPSRGVIIGKARREGLQLCPPHRTSRPKKPKVKTRPNRKLYVPRPVADTTDLRGPERREKARVMTLANIAERQAEDEAAAQTSGISFFAIKDKLCRWPLTEVNPISDFRFCGAKCEGVYCAYHTRRSIGRYAAEAAE